MGLCFTPLFDHRLEAAIRSAKHAWTWDDQNGNASLALPTYRNEFLYLFGKCGDVLCRDHFVFGVFHPQILARIRSGEWREKSLI